MNPHLATPVSHHGVAVEDAAIVVLAVHGRGQSAQYMAALAERVGLDGVAWVLPNASDNTWYPEGFLRPHEENQPRLGQALEAVGSHFGELSGGPTPVVLFGFSQGACLLSEYLLTEQPRCAGAILHTGGYLGPDEREWPDRGGVLADLPVLMATAEKDEWVPLHRVEATARAFAMLGARVECDIYDDTEHHVNDNAVTRIRKFLRRRVIACQASV
jgi:phospholipase/carboxylesterase